MLFAVRMKYMQFNFQPDEFRLYFASKSGPNYGNSSLFPLILVSNKSQYCISKKNTTFKTPRSNNKHQSQLNKQLFNEKTQIISTASMNCSEGIDI